MKYLLPVLIVFFCLAGFGCLERALEYPKGFTADIDAVAEQDIEAVGVVRSIDSGNSRFQIETAGGFVEEVGVASETAISLKDGATKTFVDILPGVLAEVSGSRDPTTTTIKAETIKLNDLTKIVLSSPKTSVTITSPLIVEGFAKTADQKIYWRIKDINNAVQLSGSNFVGGDGKNYTSFRVEIYLPTLDANGFTLEVFSKQQQTEIGLVSLPLNLLSTNKSELQIFFANNQKNTAGTCDAVFPVTRTVAETSATGRAALIELLNGTNNDEKYQGYRSSLPIDTTITSFVISGGAATIKVSGNLDYLSACEKQRAMEQIKQTLLQIDLVDEVEIQTEKWSPAGKPVVPP